MKRYIFLLTTIFALLVLGTPSAQATLHYGMDFDGLTPGTVIAGDLNTAGTGASGAGWFFPANRGASFSVEADGGGLSDLALLADDPDATGNGGEIQIIGFNLTTPVDLPGLGAGGTAQVNFEVASRRSGTNKRQLYRLANDTAVQALDLLWNNDGTFTVNGVVVGGAGTLPLLTPNLDPWDSSSSLVYPVNITVSDAGAVNGTFAGVAFTSNLANGVTNIDRFQYWTSGSSAQAKGGYLNDITIETFAAIPEPSSLALVFAGLLGILAYRAR